MKVLVRAAMALALGAGLVVAQAGAADAGPAVTTTSTSGTAAAAAVSGSNGVAVTYAPDHSYHVFAVNNSGKVRQDIYIPGRGWGSQTIVTTGVVRGTPGVVYYAPTNRYDVFAVGTNGALYQTVTDNGWSAWHAIGGPGLVPGVTAIRDVDGLYHVFGVDRSGALIVFTFLRGRWIWRDVSSGGRVSGTPGVSYDSVNDSYFVVDSGLNGALYYKTIADPSTGWRSAGGSNLRSGATVVTTPTAVQVFVVNYRGTMYLSARSGQFTSLGGVVRGTPGALVTQGGARTDVFAVGTNGSLYQQIIANGRGRGWARVGDADLA